MQSKVFIILIFLLYFIDVLAQIPSRRLEKGNIQVRSFESRHQTQTDNSIATSAASEVPVLRQSVAYNERYRLIPTYVPEANEPAKIFNINFNIFQNQEGGGNFSPFTSTADSLRLIQMLKWINDIYANQPFCEISNTHNSDPPPGVEVSDLKNKYIQFRLNGLYVYSDSSDAGLWKSNNAGLLLQRIAATDSNRMKQLNICFTEGYYLGSVRNIDIINGGQHYAHPLVAIKGGGGHGAKAIAIVSPNGGIQSIRIFEGGSGYRRAPEVVINGGEGSGAVARAVINERNGSVERIDVLEAGAGYKKTLVFFSGGGGSSAEAFVHEIHRGRITSVVLTSRGNGYSDNPQLDIVTDSRGSGAVLVPVVQGATGFTTMPSYRNADMFIVQKSLWNDGKTVGDYAFATNIAHELGHVLGLSHTYNQVSETNNINHPDYLWDVFGLPFSGYHTINWGKDPCESPSDMVSNNLMGGNQISQYTSPLQIGKMHRALHLYNVRRYTDCTCDPNAYWLIEKDEEWDFDIKLYKGIRVMAGTLIISGTVEMPDGCAIIVEPGAGLHVSGNGLITSGCDKLWDGSLHVKSGARFTVEPGGSYLMKDLGKLIID